MAEKGHQITLVSILPSNNPYMRKKEREKNEEYSFWVTETYVSQNSLKEGEKKNRMLMKVSDSKIIEKWISYHII